MSPLRLLHLAALASLVAASPAQGEARTTPSSQAVSWSPRDPELASRFRQMARTEGGSTVLISAEAPFGAGPSVDYAGTCFYVDSVSVIRGLVRCPTDLRTTTSFGRWIYYIESPPGSGISKPNCQVRLTVRAIQLDGGHNHSSTRPAGAPFDTTGNTGFDGDQFRIAHRWPQVGGPLEIRFWALHDSCGSTDSSQVDYVYCLAAAPLVPPAPCPPCVGTPFNIPAPQFALMPPGADYDLVGSTTAHPVNHYGLAGMHSALAAVASEWKARFPNVVTTKKLAFNDMSLQYGGVFDLNTNWLSPGHCGHRAGMECDFRTNHLGPVNPVPPPAERKFLRTAWELLQRRRFTVHPEAHPPHWHLKYYGCGTFRGPGSTLTTQPVVSCP